MLFFLFVCLFFQSQLFDDGPHKTAYIDSSRMVEFSEDIKGAIAHSNKMRKSMMASGSFSTKAVLHLNKQIQLTVYPVLNYLVK
jgi:hypothetical protein